MKFIYALLVITGIQLHATIVEIRKLDEKDVMITNLTNIGVQNVN